MSRPGGGTVTVSTMPAASEAAARAERGCGIFVGDGEYRPRRAMAGTVAAAAACRAPARRRGIPRDRYEDQRVVGYDGANRCNDNAHHARMDREPGNDAGMGEGFRGRTVDPAPASGMTMDCLPDSV